MTDSFLIFAGRRWIVVSVDDHQRVIDLLPSPGGSVPRFLGTAGGLVHARVREEMLRVFRRTDQPAYLDNRARELLKEGRDNFFRFELDRSCLFATVSGCQIFVWSGDRERNALHALLAGRGYRVESSGLTLLVDGETREQFAGHLLELTALDDIDSIELGLEVGNKRENKYDEFLPPELLAADYAAREFDLAGALRYLRQLVEAGFQPPRTDHDN